MNTEVATGFSPDNPPLSAILLGGFCAGLADFLSASINKILSGGAWTDPWKGVASGLLGKAARDGGGEMALLGVVLHFFITLAGAALLYLIVSRVKWLPRQWIVLGVLYGLAFLAMMNYVILPLSAIGRSIYPLENLHVAAFWHIVLVGLPTAWFISRALRR
jgi:hypothetical protein